MPIKEYKCENCDTLFEDIQISKEDNISCPECGNLNVIEQISLTSKPIFKGKGFYETDYKGKKNVNKMDS